MDAAALAGPAFTALIAAVGLPISLADAGLAEADAGRLAELTMAPENTPMRDANCRDISAGDARDIALRVLGAA